MIVLRWLGRSIDPRLKYHRALLTLIALAAVTGVVQVAVSGKPWWVPVEAVGVTFLGWAITREVDPDREITAIFAGIGAGAWSLLGQTTHLIFMLEALGIARIVVATTGRRPKRQDLVAVSIGAVALSFTELGFIAGFGVAIAVYIDNHFSEMPTRDGLWSSVAIAVGSGLVASATGAFSGRPPDLIPGLVVGAGVVGIACVSREPPAPTSQVDSRRKTFLEQRRLHAGRALVAVICLAGALLGGEDALAVVPVLGTVVLALGSSEVERITRPRL